MFFDLECQMESMTTTGVCFKVISANWKRCFTMNSLVAEILIWVWVLKTASSDQNDPVLSTLPLCSL